MKYLSLFFLFLVFPQKTLPAGSVNIGSILNTAAGMTIHHSVKATPSGEILGTVASGLITSESGDYFGFGKNTTIVNGPKEIQKTLEAVLMFNEIQKRLYDQPKGNAGMSYSITGVSDCGRRTDRWKPEDCFGLRRYEGDLVFGTTPDSGSPPSETAPPSTINLSLPESPPVGSGTTTPVLPDRNQYVIP